MMTRSDPCLPSAFHAHHSKYTTSNHPPLNNDKAELVEEVQHLRAPIAIYRHVAERLATASQTRELA